MPKIIGHGPSTMDAIEIGNNLVEMPGAVRLSWAQVNFLKRQRPTLPVLASCNTTDKGGPHIYAKRWWTWFVRLEDLAGLDLTPSIVSRVNKTVL